MPSTNGGRRGLIATVFAVVVLLSGVTLIGVTVASQRHASGPVVGSRASARLIDRSPSSLRSTLSVPRPDGGSPAVVGPTLGRSKPVALDIPSIDVHSDVQYLGQDSKGALETPAPGPLYDTAAWYRYSPTPGSLGPAILYGHVDSAANGPSVFFRLGELTHGDRVLVTRANGSVAIFEVDSVERYAKDNFPTKLVYSDIDHAGLRILTCGGAFDDATGHYLDNVVVFASLVGSTESKDVNP